ncbi:uncharacterized protein VTP21DRAFT_2139 [Calcarisporiella thermophila]|uniref:uncharacterized protein n=1 Tax=Calcarisporiella thermophila TaxID=911321 RepID=UPI00374441D2
MGNVIGNHARSVLRDRLVHVSPESTSSSPLIRGGPEIGMYKRTAQDRHRVPVIDSMWNTKPNHLPTEVIPQADLCLGHAKDNRRLCQHPWEFRLDKLAGAMGRDSSSPGGLRRRGNLKQPGNSIVAKELVPQDEYHFISVLKEIIALITCRKKEGKGFPGLQVYAHFAKVHGLEEESSRSNHSDGLISKLDSGIVFQVDGCVEQLGFITTLHPLPYPSRAN